MNKQIAEIENFVVRDAAAAKNLEDLGRPNEVFAAVIPAAQRSTRAAMIQTVNSYFSAIEKNDGKGDYSFLAPDCTRIQNGGADDKESGSVEGVSSSGVGGGWAWRSRWSCSRAAETGSEYFRAGGVWSN
ncbi:MAG: hypothetical protein WDO18_00650 [Acidobacteriota bacterium]